MVVLVNFVASGVERLFLYFLILCLYRTELAGRVTWWGTRGSQNRQSLSKIAQDKAANAIDCVALSAIQCDRSVQRYNTCAGVANCFYTACLFGVLYVQSRHAAQARGPVALPQPMVFWRVKSTETGQFWTKYSAITTATAATTRPTANRAATATKLSKTGPVCTSCHPLTPYHFLWLTPLLRRAARQPRLATV